MKRIICLILALSFLLLLCGCGEKTPKYTAPVQFYYLNPIVSTNNIGYGETYSVFISETRDGTSFIGDLDAFLKEYLKGPTTTDLYSNIPSDTQLLEVKKNAKAILITFSEEFGKLLGIDLTLACSSLSITLFESFPVSSIEIRAEGALLDGKGSVIIRRDNIQLIDTLPEIFEQEQTEVP